MEIIKKFILRFLEVIEYEGDKNEVVEKITYVINLDLLDSLSGNLNKSERQKIQLLLKDSESNNAKISNFFSSKFQKQHLLDTLSYEIKKTLSDFFKDVLPTLDNNKMEQVKKLFSEFSNQT